MKGDLQLEQFSERNPSDADPLLGSQEVSDAPVVSSPSSSCSSEIKDEDIENGSLPCCRICLENDGEPGDYIFFCIITLISFEIWFNCTLFCYLNFIFFLVALTIEKLFNCAVEFDELWFCVTISGDQYFCLPWIFFFWGGLYGCIESFLGNWLLMKERKQCKGLCILCSMCDLWNW